ncbi:hypothetical protein CVU37_03900 [candidate division BRC1 bacterium HGW-BRC1-1]|jgi:uncharacterized Tic20 family protein|nr:MAG: hypothetical protein CVU37_03900 [candidate division BRC1 bacterium HGW-BRC1-1]
MTEIVSPTQPSNQDRLAAAVAHLAGIVPLFGMLIPAGIWAASRSDNKFLKTNATRALAAQIFLLVYLLLIPGLGTILALIFAANQAGFFTGIIHTLSIFTLQAGLVLSWLMFAYAAVRVYLDGDFRYPVLTLAIEGPPPAPTS